MVRTRTLIKIISFFLFALICFIQCYAIISSYLKYPVIIDMYDVPQNLINSLPGITLCNNNRLSLIKLLKRKPQIRKAILEKYPDWVNKGQSSVDNFNQFRDDLSRIYQTLNYQPQLDLENSNLDAMFSIKPDSDEFIKWLGCARTWTDSVECEQLIKLDSIQDRKCITILHQGAIAYALENTPQIFNSSQSISGQYSYFDAKEVIQMVVDFKPEDYGDLRRQIGARIVFHSNSFVPSLNELDFFITRGFRYDFNIDREQMILIDKPYVGCYDYEGNNLHKFKEKVEPRVPLYQDTCVQNCIIINMVRYTDCWPPTIPYFKNDALDPNKTMKACGWANDPYALLYREMLRVIHLKLKKKLVSTSKNQTNNHSTTQAEFSQNKNAEHALDERTKIEMKNYNIISRYCRKRCNYNCSTFRYSVTVTKSPWPTEARISLDKTGRGRELNHCCALITVKQAHFHHTVQEMLPKYNLIDTLGNVGGLLAVWLGLSIVSVYNAVQKLIELFNQHQSKSKSKSR